MRLKTEDLITKDECMDFDTTSRKILEEGLPFYVYFLVDPFTFKIKYVGEGQGNRFKKHWIEFEGNPSKQAWMNKLSKKETTYLVAIWEFYSTKEHAREQEDLFIYAMGRKGIDNKGTLLNIKRDTDSHHLVPKISNKSFIRRAVKVHGNLYDYNESVYKGYGFPVKIRCKKHGYFYPQAGNHLGGTHCFDCSYETRVKSKLSPFVNRAKVLFGDRFNYDKVVYSNNKVPVIIHCNLCDEDFEQVPRYHLKGGSCKCKC